MCKPEEGRTKEGHTGGVDGPEFSQIFLIMIFTEFMSFLQNLPLSARDLLKYNHMQDELHVEL